MGNNQRREVNLELLNSGDVLQCLGLSESFGLAPRHGVSPLGQPQSRYRILRSLDSGGFSRTHLAEDLNCFNELCVLKEFAPQLKEGSTLEKAQELFEREAGVLYRLEHPQIPQFRQLFCCQKQNEEHLFLVQDYVAGETYHALLNQRIKSNQKFSEAEIKQLLRDVLPVLEYIHSMGVIHRDISPDNLILRSQDKLTVLIDFGCIKEVEIKIQSELSNPTIPLIYTAIGKAGYAPPEQIERGIVYAHCDLYALAATAVVLLTRKEPQQLIDFNNYRWHWQSTVSISSKLEWILSTMLAPNPSDRFGSAAEVSKILQDISKIAPPLPLETPPEQSSYRRFFRTKIEMPLWRNLAGKITGYSRGIQAAKPVSAVRSLSVRNSLQWRKLRTYKFTLASTKSLFLIPLTAILILLGGYLYLKATDSEVADSKVAKTESIIASDQLKARISQGEKLLIKQATTSAKNMAIDAMARGKYSQAVSLFEASLQAVPNDPEALIYLNNANISTAKAYSIAVAVPIGSNVNAAEEILRGVAQAQNRINHTGGINNLPLKVQIVNDDNDPAIAKAIAHNLGQNQEILGVVGHYTSDVTLATAPIYEANKLVAISPISTSVKLSNLSPYIFRTVPSDFLAARGLAEYMLNNIQQKRVAVFYNSQSNYSKSLESEFTAAVNLGGGEVVTNFDLADATFNAEDCLTEAFDNGAEVIMLAANTDTLDQALQVIQVNDKRLNLLGGDAVYNPETLQIAGEPGENMVLAIPWHIQNSPNNEFVRTAENLWKGGVSWRSTMAYDAVQALIAAMKNDTDSTRTSIQRSLSSSDFSTAGATNQVKFLPSSDRMSKIQLVKIQPSDKGFGHEFVPIENE